MEEVCSSLLVKEHSAESPLLLPVTHEGHIPLHPSSPGHLPVFCSPMQQDDLWHLPGRLRINPSLWDKEDVALWLLWAQKEYSLRLPEKGHFQMNGRALCLLTKEDFRRRCPSSGDVLYEILQCVKQQRRKACEAPNMPQTGNSVQIQSPVCSQMSFHHAQPATVIPAVTVTAASPTTVAPQQPQPTQRDPRLIVHQTHSSLSQNVLLSPQSKLLIKTECKNEDTNLEPLNLSSRKRPRSPLQGATGRIPECRLLWDYVYQLLCDDRYQDYIRWEDPDSMVFRVVDPNGLAQLWGNHKNRDNMTYEKMSRALRHYYKLNIIKKEQGQKLFRFLKTPQDLKKQAFQDESFADSPPQNSPTHEEHHFEVSPEDESPPRHSTPFG